jgi:uncharacterized protein (DUF1778 family)
MSLEKFMGRFDDSAAAMQSGSEAPVETGFTSLADQWSQTSVPGALDKFIDKFNGVTEPYYFYYVNGEPTVELRFQTEEHVYYLVGELGQLTPQDGVTTICHIIDKSPALVPWSAKMVIQKLLTTVPTYVDENGCCMMTQMSFSDFEKIALEAKSAPRDKLNEAGDVGHMAHTWLEYYIKAIIAKHQMEVESKLLNLPKDERAANCVKASLDWQQQHNVRWIETERKIYSKKYSYAGTMDGLAYVSSCNNPACCPTPFKDRLSIIDWKSSNYLYVEYLYQTAAYEAAYEEEFGVEIEDRWIIRLGKEDGAFDPWHTTEEDFQEDFEGFLDALSLTRSVRLTNERMKGQKKAVREAKKAMKEAAKEADKQQRKEARKALVADRRAKKALEREAKKEAKKRERAVLKAQIVPVETPTIKLSEADSKVFVEALTNPPEPNDALNKAAGTITGRWPSDPEVQFPFGHSYTPLVDQPTEIVNGTLVTVDLSAIEQRVIASLLPQEEVIKYIPQLPPEA